MHVVLGIGYAMVYPPLAKRFVVVSRLYLVSGPLRSSLVLEVGATYTDPSGFSSVSRAFFSYPFLQMVSNSLETRGAQQCLGTSTYISILFIIFFIIMFDVFYFLYVCVCIIDICVPLMNLSEMFELRGRHQSGGLWSPSTWPPSSWEAYQTRGLWPTLPWSWWLGRQHTTDARNIGYKEKNKFGNASFCNKKNNNDAMHIFFFFLSCFFFFFCFSALWFGIVCWSNLSAKVHDPMGVSAFAGGLG